MNNDELVIAIDYAYNCCYNGMSGNIIRDETKAMLEHLKALLAEQLKRAQGVMK